MTSVATHALRACSSLGALCSFKPCTIISQLANLPSPILLQAIIIVFFKFKISLHESLITFFYNSLKNINEHILGLSPFVCIFFKWGQTSILRSIKTRSVPVCLKRRSVPVCNFKLASGHGRARSGHHNGAKRMWNVV